MSVDPRIAKLMSDVFGVPAGSIHARTGADDIESWDSVKQLELVVALEGAFGVSIDPDDALTLDSYEAIAALLSRIGS